MKLQIIGMVLMTLVVGVFVVLLSGGNRFTANQADAAATAGGGVPQGYTVTSSAGGTAMLLANPLRKALRCQNVDATNGVYITFGQTPTSSNGFYLSPGAAATPVQAANVINFPSTDCASTGCVPLGTVNAIAAASTAKVVCWED